MSELHTIKIAFSTRESYHWTPQHQIEFENDSDRVCDMLQEVAEKAVTAYIKANSDIFNYDGIL